MENQKTTKKNTYKKNISCKKKEDRLKILKKMEKLIKIKFKNINLLDQALTHSSYKRVTRSNIDNERMEFLGDSILGFFISEYLYLNYPEYDEGQLTRIKNYTVSKTFLYIVGTGLNIGQYLKLSSGEDKNKGRSKASIISSSVEALLGAIYLDQGQKKSKEFLQKFFFSKIKKDVQDSLITDYKSEVQFLFQKKLKTIPQYKVLEKKGPSHNTLFTVGLNINGEEFVQGQGCSKKIAEHQAAKDLWTKIQEGKMFSQFKKTKSP